MPRGDGTGPMGMGRMTGRGAGYCAGRAAPGYEAPAGAMGGFGCRFGGGRGARNRAGAAGRPGWAFFGPPGYAGAAGEAPDERAFLSNRAEFLERQLQQVKQRLSHLKDDEE